MEPVHFRFQQEHPAYNSGQMRASNGYVAVTSGLAGSGLDPLAGHLLSGSATAGSLGSSSGGPTRHLRQDLTSTEPGWSPLGAAHILRMGSGAHGRMDGSMWHCSLMDGDKKQGKG